MLNSVSGEVEYKILYHYTNVKGLMGILDSQCLWATDFRYTNDLSEIRYAKGIMKKVAMAYGDLKGDIGKNLDIILEMFLGDTKDILLFLFSVCDDGGDRLSQWRGYGSEGGGYSIGLSCRELDKLKIQDMKKHYYDFIDFDKVFYGEMPQEFKDEFHEMLKFFDDYFQYKTEEIPEALEKHALILIKCLCRIKHLGFGEEKEYRVTAGLPESKRKVSGNLVHRTIKFRPSASGTLVPYVELFREEDFYLPIKEIVIGPSRDMNERKDALDLLIKKKKLDIPVRKSDIPYRE